MRYSDANSQKIYTRQERRRLSTNYKIAKMTTSTKKTFYDDENTNRPLRIVKGYTDDQEGKDIRDEDVVRPSNGKYTKQGSLETNSWQQKSSAGCPTYGTCGFCFKAGPTGKKCVCTNGGYGILFYRGYIIDSIMFGEMFVEELEVAKADRMKTWNITPTMQLNSDCCDLGILRKIKKDNPTMSDDDKKELRLKRLRHIWDLQSEIIQFR
jgi:hypothetical protein